MLSRMLTALSFLILSIPCISASATVIDFEDRPVESKSQNFTNQGYVFSVNCHYDLLDTAGDATKVSKWIGFDASGCGSQEWTNENYLGPDVGGRAKLFVTSENGAKFDLQSLQFVSVDLTGGGYNIITSAGGTASVSWTGTNFYTRTFTGNAFENLDWVVFSNFGGFPVGFDNLQLSAARVDEPGSLALILSIGIAVVANGVRRSTKI